VTFAYRETFMTTERTTALRLTGLALTAFPIAAGGCGAAGTNQAACRTVVDRIVECGSSFPFADLTGAIGFGVSRYCARVPETSECADWSVFADHVNSNSCDRLGSDPLTIVSLDNIVDRLRINRCLPGLPPLQGSASPDPVPETSGCEPLTGFEVCLLTSTCPQDCAE